MNGYGVNIFSTNQLGSLNLNSTTGPQFATNTMSGSLQSLKLTNNLVLVVL